ncbi:MAG: DUF4403 family protein [Thermoanaerobaculia bacterium]
MHAAGLRLLLLGLALALFAGCAGEKAGSPPAVSPPEVSMLPGEGSASFFFPVEIPLAEAKRIVEARLPRTMRDERRQEIASGITDDFFRYTLERGDVELGVAGEWITFSFPVRGKLTVGGRLLAAPVAETVNIEGLVRGTVSPAITADWKPDPRPAARIELSQAEIRVLSLFSINVRTFLESQLNPILNRELRGAADQVMAGFDLRRKAEEAWRSLHVARRALDGENLWIRFQPTALTLVPVIGREGALRTGIGIAGRIAMSLGGGVKPPAIGPLPPLRLDGHRSGGFAIEVPIAAEAGELSQVLDRSLRGSRFRAGGSREIEITAAALRPAGDLLALSLDFKTVERRPGTGTFVLRGRPVFDAAANAVRLADLQYDLASGSLFLRLADRLHRAEILEGLRKRALLDLGPLLERARRESEAAVGNLLPAGLKGDVKVEPLEVLGIGVSGGAVWARCKVTGTTSPLSFRNAPSAHGR